MHDKRHHRFDHFVFARLSCTFEKNENKASETGLKTHTQQLTEKITLYMYIEIKMPIEVQGRK